MVEKLNNARIKIGEIPSKNFTHYETGVSVIGLNYDNYAQAVHQACLRKTAINLGINYNPDINLICRTCVYNTKMPGIYLCPDGRCNMCHTYDLAKREADQVGRLEKERSECIQRVSDKEAYCDVILALSGGKDSSAVLSFLSQESDLHVKAVLVDNGFIPDLVKERCRHMCESVNIEFVIFDLDFRSKVEDVLKKKKLNIYPCYVCSKYFKRIIADFAASQNCNRVITGRNFWSTIEPTLSGVKDIKTKNGTYVRLFYLPFLMRWKYNDAVSRLEKIGWNNKKIKIPGLSTNCMVPGMVEEFYLKKTGIHPETPLLANEVISGYISRERALEYFGLKD